MSLSRKLTAFLDDHRVKYVTYRHSVAFTAQEVAASLHIPGHTLAKTVIIKADDCLAMVVLPADYRLDLEKLKQALKADSVALASEWEFTNRFPDCEGGAMPPFGNLYDMPVYVEESLTDQPDIAFNAGSHHEAIRMPYHDFEQLVNPTHIAGARHL